jgi:glucuronate isomerase
MLRELGPDTGFDSIGDFSQATAMAKFFNNLDNTNQLAKTVVYNLNPSQNEVFAVTHGGSSTRRTAWKNRSTRCRTSGC